MGQYYKILQEFINQFKTIIIMTKKAPKTPKKGGGKKCQDSGVHYRN